MTFSLSHTPSCPKKSENPCGRSGTSKGSSGLVQEEWMNGSISPEFSKRKNSLHILFKLKAQVGFLSKKMGQTSIFGRKQGKVGRDEFTSRPLDPSDG
jgi:hypothetical protein